MCIYLVQKKSVQRLIAKGAIANALFRIADGATTLLLLGDSLGS
jgi:hypothetical protein